MPQTTIAVKFGSVSFQAKSARVGISVARDNGELTLSQADKLLCGRRLLGKIVALPADENEDQGHLEGFDEKIEMHGAFDVKHIGCSPDSISFGLTFAIQGLDRETLSAFCGRHGKLTIKSSEEIPEDEKESNGEESEETEADEG